MSFIDNVDTFMKMSRVGKLLNTITFLVRKKLDTNGDGVVDAGEILQAIPVSLLNLFLPAPIVKWLPTIIEIVIDFQKAVKK